MNLYANLLCIKLCNTHNSAEQEKCPGDIRTFLGLLPQFNTTGRVIAWSFLCRQTFFSDALDFERKISTIGHIISIGRMIFL